MRAPTAFELLAVWERCAARTPGERALELLSLAGADAGRDHGALTVGERDARLLALRERTFGTTLAGAARCGGCGELVEFAVGVADVALSGSEPQSRLSLAVDGYELTFRPATAADAAAISRERDAGQARARLLERCVLEATRGGSGIDASELPASVAEAVAARMAEADPQADVELALVCPACGNAWTASFDAAVFLWDELDAWARRTLHDVHTLAAAYGWTESEILGLGPRRQVYLELAGT